MSTVPPAPPPPPPPLTLERVSPPKSPEIYSKYSPTFICSDICNWAADDPQLWEVSSKYNICLHKAPFKYKIRHFPSIMQVGPTCGLVALSMSINGVITPDKILNISKMEGYSCNGEMLSCKNMFELTGKVLNLAKIDNINCSLKVGGLFSNETVERLLNGALLLVPYDADCNHSPCLRRGHTAHWALVCGLLLIEDPGDDLTSDPANIYVFARHGKSRYLAGWRLDDLDKSNQNLMEFSPKKQADELMYVLPEGGMGGENGLRNQFLMIEPV